MIRFLADENFDNDIIRGILRRLPEVDIVRVQDVGLYSADDETVLEAAANDGRLLLTHDVRTVSSLAYERIKKGLKMSGVLEVPKNIAIGSVIDDLVLIAELTSEQNWDNQVRYLPVRNFGLFP